MTRRMTSLSLLFLDRENHRPLAVKYRAPLPARTMGRGPGGDNRQREGATQGRETEVTVLFSDYKSVKAKEISEVWLPHRLEKTVDGQVLEEITMSKYKLNPGIKAEKFEKK